MSNSIGAINFKEEVKSSLWLVLLVVLVFGYLVYAEQQKRRVPADFDTIGSNIQSTQKKIVELIEGENLPDLERSLKEVQVLAEGFGIRIQLEGHKKYLEEQKRRNIGDLEYARSHRWSGGIDGNAREVLIFARMSQQLVPIEFNSLRISGNTANAKFTIVGS